MISAIAVGPLLYQLLHPWHWLTYGQNASVVGLIVVVFYTIYTRRMMLLAQQTRRGELYPILALQEVIVKNDSMDLAIKNVGAGPLLNVFQWGQPVSERFELEGTFLERPSAIGQSFGGSMLRGEGRILNTPVGASQSRVLLVLEGTDSVGGGHQFCFLRSLAPLGTMSMRCGCSTLPTFFLFGAGLLGRFTSGERDCGSREPRRWRKQLPSGYPIFTSFSTNSE